MTRPLILDLFCGAGGAAAGYDSAGFDVIGVDVEPQPHYPFQFIQAEAMEFIRDQLEFGGIRPLAAIHASPPCQGYTVAKSLHPDKEYPKLIPEVRRYLRASGLPYVIENVPGAPMVRPTLICGLALGLGVKRHRLFETSFPLTAPLCPPDHPGDWVTVFGRSVRSREAKIMSKDERRVGIDIGRRAMGIEWMSRAELSEAIPPAYTELVGKQLMEHLS